MNAIIILSILAVCFLCLIYGFSLGRQHGIQLEREKGHEYDTATLKKLIDDAAKHLSEGERYTLDLALRKNERKHPVAVPMACKIQSQQKWQDQ